MDVASSQMNFHPKGFIYIFKTLEKPEDSEESESNTNNYERGCTVTTHPEMIIRSGNNIIHMKDNIYVNYN